MKFINNNTELGFWIETDYAEEWYGLMVECSKCGHWTLDEGNYCSNCGRKMFKDVKDETI